MTDADVLRDAARIFRDHAGQDSEQAKLVSRWLKAVARKIEKDPSVIRREEAKFYLAAARKARRYAAMPQNIGQRAHLMRIARGYEKRARYLLRGQVT